MLARRRSRLSLALATALAAALVGACSSDPAGLDPRLDVAEQAPGDTLFASVDVGGHFACALTSMGRAFCWGYNVSGILSADLASLPECANSSSSCIVPRPVPVAGGLRFTAIDAGGSGACGLAPSGRVHCWGWQAGLKAVRSPVFGGIRAREIRVIGGDLCVRAEGGAIHCDRPFIDGMPNDQPRLVSSPPFAALGSVCGLTAAGKIYCFSVGGALIGVDSVRQDLSGISRSTCHVGTPGFSYSYPCTLDAVPLRTELRFARLPKSGLHSCALTSAGEAYCWDLDFRDDDHPWDPGAYAGGVAPSAVPQPVRLALPGPARDLLRIGSLDCAHLESGGVACRGVSWLGESGNGVRHDSLRTFAPAAGGRAFRSVASDWGNFACGVTPAGEAYCWGRGDLGQLGGGALPADTYTTESLYSLPFTYRYAASPTRVASIAGLVSAPVPDP